LGPQVDGSNRADFFADTGGGNPRKPPESRDNDLVDADSGWVHGRQAAWVQ
jgi:hypothetical protein